MRAVQPQPYITIVVPVYNEALSVGLLYQEIITVLRSVDYEIIFVDDGSTDTTPQVLATLADLSPRVRVVTFARNFGKAQALAAGFRESQGSIIVTLDGDLQDDPREILRLVGALEGGYDLANGWKQERHDPASKRFPSRVFNFVTSRLTGIHLKDFNSGIKAYRREVVDRLQLYGELHRFIPALAYWEGFRVTELPVRHRPRQFGRSKFGGRRFLSGMLDLLTVLYLTRFRRQPLHLFGPIGLSVLAVGLGIDGYLTVLRLLGQTIGTRPLLTLGVLLTVTGIQFLSVGLLGEMITLSLARGGQELRPYSVVQGNGRPAASTLPPVLAEAVGAGIDHQSRGE